MPERADGGTGGAGAPGGDARSDDVSARELRDGCSEGGICVEVVYAEPDRAVTKCYRLSPEAVMADALRIAAADPDFRGIAVDGAAAGVFGRVADATQPLSEGDRIEIYRPLAADPKNARRARARQAARQSRR